MKRVGKLRRRDEVDVRVDPAGSPGVTPSMMPGLPALPIAAMRPSRTPTSAL
jgi:hypothetical protein